MSHKRIEVVHAAQLGTNGFVIVRLLVLTAVTNAAGTLQLAVRAVWVLSFVLPPEQSLVCHKWVITYNRDLPSIMMSLKAVLSEEGFAAPQTCGCVNTQAFIHLDRLLNNASFRMPTCCALSGAAHVDRHSRRRRQCVQRATTHCESCLVGRPTAAISTVAACTAQHADRRCGCCCSRVALTSPTRFP
jgi:hypothetical protein